jgi:uncharacterized membrane protein
MQQKELSVWLRAVVVLVFACCLFLAVIVVPEQSHEYLSRHPEYTPLFLPGLIFFWTTLLPVFASLLLAWRIFTEIGRDNSFCEKNALRLRRISRLALLDTVLYILFAVVQACLGLLHPEFVPMYLAVIFVGVAMTITTAALSHLTRKAADLKSENDLTI